MVMVTVVGCLPIRQPADGAWKWKSRAGMNALLPGGFTEFGRSKIVQNDEENFSIC